MVVGRITSNTWTGNNYNVWQARDVTRASLPPDGATKYTTADQVIDAVNVCLKSRKYDDARDILNNADNAKLLKALNNPDCDPATLIAKIDKLEAADKKAKAAIQIISDYIEKEDPTPKDPTSKDADFLAAENEILNNTTILTAGGYDSKDFVNAVKAARILKQYRVIIMGSDKDKYAEARTLIEESATILNNAGYTSKDILKNISTLEKGDKIIDDATKMSSNGNTSGAVTLLNDNKGILNVGYGETKVTEIITSFENAPSRVAAISQIEDYLKINYDVKTKTVETKYKEIRAYLDTNKSLFDAVSLAEINQTIDVQEALEEANQARSDETLSQIVVSENELYEVFEKGDKLIGELFDSEKNTDGSTKWYFKAGAEKLINDKVPATETAKKKKLLEMANRSAQSAEAVRIIYDEKALFISYYASEIETEISAGAKDKTAEDKADEKKSTADGRFDDLVAEFSKKGTAIIKVLNDWKKYTVSQIDFDPFVADASDPEVIALFTKVQTLLTEVADKNGIPYLSKEQYTEGDAGDAATLFAIYQFNSDNLAKDGIMKSDVVAIFGEDNDSWKQFFKNADPEVGKTLEFVDGLVEGQALTPEDFTAARIPDEGKREKLKELFITWKYPYYYDALESLENNPDGYIEVPIDCDEKLVEKLEKKKNEQTSNIISYDVKDRIWQTDLATELYRLDTLGVTKENAPWFVIEYLKKALPNSATRLDEIAVSVLSEKGIVKADDYTFLMDGIKNAVFDKNIALLISGTPVDAKGKVFINKFSFNPVDPTDPDDKTILVNTSLQVITTEQDNKLYTAFQSALLTPIAYYRKMLENAGISLPSKDINSSTSLDYFTSADLRSLAEKFSDGADPIVHYGVGKDKDLQDFVSGDLVKIAGEISKKKLELIQAKDKTKLTAEIEDLEALKTVLEKFIITAGSKETDIKIDTKERQILVDFCSGTYSVTPDAKLVEKFVLINQTIYPDNPLAFSSAQVEAIKTYATANEGKRILWEDIENESENAGIIALRQKIDEVCSTVQQDESDISPVSAKNTPGAATQSSISIFKRDIYGDIEEIIDVKGKPEDVLKNSVIIDAKQNFMTNGVITYELYNKIAAKITAERSWFEEKFGSATAYINKALFQASYFEVNDLNDPDKEMRFDEALDIVTNAEKTMDEIGLGDVFRSQGFVSLEPGAIDYTIADNGELLTPYQLHMVRKIKQALSVVITMSTMSEGEAKIDPNYNTEMFVSALGGMLGLNKIMTLAEEIKSVAVGQYSSLQFDPDFKTYIDSYFDGSLTEDQKQNLTYYDIKIIQKLFEQEKTQIDAEKQKDATDIYDKLEIILNSVKKEDWGEILDLSENDEDRKLFEGIKKYLIDNKNITVGDPNSLPGGTDDYTGFFARYFDVLNPDTWGSIFENFNGEKFWDDISANGLNIPEQFVMQQAFLRILMPVYIYLGLPISAIRTMFVKGFGEGTKELGKNVAIMALYQFAPLWYQQAMYELKEKHYGTALGMIWAINYFTLMGGWNSAWGRTVQPLTTILKIMEKVPGLGEYLKKQDWFNKTMGIERKGLERGIEGFKYLVDKLPYGKTVRKVGANVIEAVMDPWKYKYAGKIIRQGSSLVARYTIRFPISLCKGTWNAVTKGDFSFNKLCELGRDITSLKNWEILKVEAQKSGETVDYNIDYLSYSKLYGENFLADEVEKNLIKKELKLRINPEAPNSVDKEQTDLAIEFNKNGGDMNLRGKEASIKIHGGDINYLSSNGEGSLEGLISLQNMLTKAQIGEVSGTSPLKNLYNDDKLTLKVKIADKGVTVEYDLAVTEIQMSETATEVSYIVTKPSELSGIASYEVTLIIPADVTKEQIEKVIGTEAKTTQDIQSTIVASDKTAQTSEPIPEVTTELRNKWDNFVKGVVIDEKPFILNDNQIQALEVLTKEGVGADKVMRMLNMFCGEGKTNVGILAAKCLALGIDGKGPAQRIQVLTSSGTLAREWAKEAVKMGLVEGVDFAVITQAMTPDQMKKAYECRIVVGDNQLIFNTKTGNIPQALLAVDYVIIDEADKFLIDDATNAFIIAGESTSLMDPIKYKKFVAAYVKSVEKSYDIYNKMHGTEETIKKYFTEEGLLTEDGINFIKEQIEKYQEKNLNEEINRIEKFRLQTMVKIEMDGLADGTIKTRKLTVDHNFVIKDGKILAVDKSGQPQENQKYSDFNDEAIRMVWDLKIESPTSTLASTTGLDYVNSAKKGFLGFSGTLAEDWNSIISPLYPGMELYEIPRNIKEFVLTNDTKVDDLIKEIKDYTKEHPKTEGKNWFTVVDCTSASNSAKRNDFNTKLNTIAGLEKNDVVLVKNEPMLLVENSETSIEMQVESAIKEAVLGKPVLVAGATIDEVEKIREAILDRINNLTQAEVDKIYKEYAEEMKESGLQPADQFKTDLKSLKKSLKDGLKTLTAENIKDAAKLIKNAGKQFHILVATTCGRGIDVKPDKKTTAELTALLENITLSDASIKCGGLHVVVTSLDPTMRELSQKINRAARSSNSGREPGSSFICISLDDPSFTDEDRIKIKENFKVNKSTNSIEIDCNGLADKGINDLNIGEITVKDVYDQYAKKVYGEIFRELKISELKNRYETTYLDLATKILDGNEMVKILFDADVKTVFENNNVANGDKLTIESLEKIQLDLERYTGIKISTADIKLLAGVDAETAQKAISEKIFKLYEKYYGGDAKNSKAKMNNYADPTMDKWSYEVRTILQDNYKDFEEEVQRIKKKYSGPLGYGESAENAEGIIDREMGGAYKRMYGKILTTLSKKLLRSEVAGGLKKAWNTTKNTWKYINSKNMLTISFSKEEIGILKETSKTNQKETDKTEKQEIDQQEQKTDQAPKFKAMGEILQIYSTKGALLEDKVDEIIKKYDVTEEVEKKFIKESLADKYIPKNTEETNIDEKTDNIGGAEAGTTVSEADIKGIRENAVEIDADSAEKYEIDKAIESLKNKGLLFEGIDPSNITFKKVYNADWGNIRGNAVFSCDADGKYTVYLKESVLSPSYLEKLIRIFYRGFGKTKALSNAVLHETTEIALSKSKNILFDGDIEPGTSEKSSLTEKAVHEIASQIVENAGSKTPVIDNTKLSQCVVTSDRRVAKVVQTGDKTTLEFLDIKVPEFVMSLDGKLLDNELQEVKYFEKDGKLYKQKDGSIFEYGDNKWAAILDDASKDKLEIKNQINEFTKSSISFVVIATAIGIIEKLIKGEEIKAIEIAKEAGNEFAGITIFTTTNKLISSQGWLSESAAGKFNFMYAALRNCETEEDVVSAIGNIAGFEAGIGLAGLAKLPTWFGLVLGLALSKVGEGAADELAKEFPWLVDNTVTKSAAEILKFNAAYNPAEILGRLSDNPYRQNLFATLGTVKELQILYKFSKPGLDIANKFMLRAMYPKMTPLEIENLHLQTTTKFIKATTKPIKNIKPFKFVKGLGGYVTGALNLGLTIYSEWDNYSSDNRYLRNSAYFKTGGSVVSSAGMCIAPYTGPWAVPVMLSAWAVQIGFDQYADWKYGQGIDFYNYEIEQKITAKYYNEVYNSGLNETAIKEIKDNNITVQQSVNTTVPSLNGLKEDFYKNNTKIQINSSFDPIVQSIQLFIGMKEGTGADGADGYFGEITSGKLGEYLKGIISVSDIYSVVGDRDLADKIWKALIESEIVAVYNPKDEVGMIPDSTLNDVALISFITRYLDSANLGLEYDMEEKITGAVIACRNGTLAVDVIDNYTFAKMQCKTERFGDKYDDYYENAKVVPDKAGNTMGLEDVTGKGIAVQDLRDYALIWDDIKQAINLKNAYLKTLTKAGQTAWWMYFESLFDKKSPERCIAFGQVISKMMETDLKVVFTDKKEDKTWGDVALSGVLTGGNPIVMITAYLSSDGASTSEEFNFMTVSMASDILKMIGKSDVYYKGTEERKKDYIYIKDLTKLGEKDLVKAWDALVTAGYIDETGKILILEADDKFLYHYLDDDTRDQLKSSLSLSDVDILRIDWLFFEAQQIKTTYDWVLKSEINTEEKYTQNLDENYEQSVRDEVYGENTFNDKTKVRQDNTYVSTNKEKIISTVMDMSYSTEEKDEAEKFSQLYKIANKWDKETLKPIGYINLNTIAGSTNADDIALKKELLFIIEWALWSRNYNLKTKDACIYKGTTPAEFATFIVDGINKLKSAGFIDITAYLNPAANGSSYILPYQMDALLKLGVKMKKVSADYKAYKKSKS